MSRLQKRSLVIAALILSALLGLLADSPAYASHGDGLECCGQPLTCGTSNNPSAVDCLFILNAAVGLQSCDFCDCDSDGSWSITATDSLVCLHGAVGLPFAKDCCHFGCPSPECQTTSSTTSTTTTTTTSTTTTTLPSQDPRCPNKGEIIVHAGTSRTSCSSNGDCTIGSCDTNLGLCVTDTEVDFGWNGYFHDQDLNNLTKRAVALRCLGPFDAMSSVPCGDCDVVGLLAETGDCRCNNDNRTICDEPFVADADDCGGAMCDCYLGAPLPLSAGNSGACIHGRFASDVTGTVNVDLGSGTMAAQIRASHYLGINLILPCPACGGTCTAPPAKVGKTCAVNIGCDTFAGSDDGVCANYDVAANDGVRDGTCVGGHNDGESCDIGAYNSTFPAPGPSSAGMSLDCFPDPGKNVSGLGLHISLTQTTATSALPAAGIECGFPPGLTYNCPCGLCSNDISIACSSNAACVPPGVCASDGFGRPLPDHCTPTGNCINVGAGEGACGEGGPTDKLCDGIVRANGEGFIACLGNADCEPGNIGLDAGACTLTRTPDCFLDPITATGTPDPTTPIGVATFCVGKGAASTYIFAGQPGPARVRNQIAATTFCAGDPGTQYVPGVGGCP